MKHLRRPRGKEENRIDRAGANAIFGGFGKFRNSRSLVKALGTHFETEA